MRTNVHLEEPFLDLVIPRISKPAHMAEMTKTTFRRLTAYKLFWTVGNPNGAETGSFPATRPAERGPANGIQAKDKTIPVCCLTLPSLPPPSA